MAPRVGYKASHIAGTGALIYDSGWIENKLSSICLYLWQQQASALQAGSRRAASSRPFRLACRSRLLSGSL